jgi:peroxiredoxin
MIPAQLHKHKGDLPMELEQTLSHLRDKIAKMIPAEPAAVMEGHIEFLRKSGAVDKILKPGAKAPAFTLKNQHGEEVSSADLLKRGPLVVSFTRGGWCPFCAAQVRALNEVYDQYQQAGVDLVVLSPQSADRAQKQATADKLKFNLLVDANNEVGKAFGVVYTFPEDLKIPARFIIDTNGIIRDAKADPDYRYSPDPSEALGIVNTLGVAKAG